MSAAQPPPTKDVIEVSPGQVAAVITSLEAATYSGEFPVLVAIASLKTMLKVYGKLALPRITVQQLRRCLGVPPPKKDDGMGKDGDDVPPPVDDEKSDSDDSGAATEPKEPEDDDKSDGDDNGDDNGAAAELKAPEGAGEVKKPAEISGGKPPRIRKDGQPYGHDKHGRRGKEDFPDALQRYFAHPGFDHPGCRCTDCDKLKVYLMGAVGGGLRFTGQPHLTVTCVNREIWRCGDCGAHFPAPLPADLSGDGGNSRVGHTAAATIACAKYLYGTPWARQESFGSLLDLHIPATTQWQQVLALVTAAVPVYRYLFKVAAPASLFFSDDTGARIIGLTAEDKTQRKTGKTVNRTGVHTSCVVSVLPDGRHILIYKTAIIHAGELLDEILVNRPKGLIIPQHMSDGLSANPPTACIVIEGECNAHARRKLEEKKEQWPAAWKYVESVYETVYANEGKSKVEGMNPKERLALHRQESLPSCGKCFAGCKTVSITKSSSPTATSARSSNTS